MGKVIMCVTCRWYEVDNLVWGTCHRRSPSVVFVSGGDVKRLRDVFPTVMSTDWCGDYERRE